MSDEQIKQRLQEALAERQPGPAPAFAPTLAAAERRMQATVRRHRAAAGLAAAAVVAAAFILWPSQNLPQPEYLSEQALFSSTAWVAPSDVLLPQYEFDVYRELPVLNDFTGLQEGSLL